MWPPDGFFWWYNTGFVELEFIPGDGDHTKVELEDATQDDGKYMYKVRGTGKVIKLHKLHSSRKTYTDTLV